MGAGVSGRWGGWALGWVEVMPLDPNSGSSFAGQVIRLGGRQSAASSCRSEVVGALTTLSARDGAPVSTVREVYAEMLAHDRDWFDESTNPARSSPLGVETEWG